MNKITRIEPVNNNTDRKLPETSTVCQRTSCDD